jgi:hypothetical protein
MEDDEEFMSDGGVSKVVHTGKSGKTLGKRAAANDKV